MERIGNQVVIHTATLLVPEGQSAWVEFPANTWNVRINVIFLDDPSFPESRTTLQGVGDHAEMRITNWNNALPMATEQPSLLGSTDNHQIMYMFSGFRVGGMRQITLQFFWGDQL